MFDVLDGPESTARGPKPTIVHRANFGLGKDGNGSKAEWEPARGLAARRGMRVKLDESLSGTRPGASELLLVSWTPS